MALFTTLYSGSSGNCGLIREGNEYLLVDMGKSCRTTLTALRRLDLAISDCAGIQPGRDVLIQAQERNDISPYIEF